MPRMNVPYPIGLASVLLLVGCVTTSEAPISVQQRTLESLSVQAYERAVPHLTALKAGDPIDPMWWEAYGSVQQGKQVPVPVRDGWVAPLSGNFIGAQSGFGSLIGQTGNLLLGEHLFGYLLWNSMLVPQYVLLTQATVISRDEYDRLGGHRAPNVNWARTGARELTYFKDLSVKETRKLHYAGPRDIEGAEIGEKIDIAEFVSLERFEAAKRNLESLAPGTDYWDVVAALKMKIVTFDFGLTYRAWLADGYLGAGWAKLTPKGYFRVWRFGYIQDNKEFPRLALIFKNNRVHKLVPNGTREELEQYFE